MLMPSGRRGILSDCCQFIHTFIDRPCSQNPYFKANCRILGLCAVRIMPKSALFWAELGLFGRKLFVTL